MGAKSRTALSVAFLFAMSANSRASEVVGTVFEAKSGKPVPGAYVMAVYFESGGTWFGHSGRWCVRTAGMQTALDGSFSLPAGDHMELHVIKEGLVENKALSERPHISRWYETKSERSTKLFVEPMVAGGRKSRYVECERPATRADVDANIAYLKLLEKEQEMNGANQQALSAPRQALARFDKMK